MIVITSLSRQMMYIMPGDTFSLRVNDGSGTETIITEKCTKSCNMDYMASFRFCMEDGTCIGNHLAGIFADSNNLPSEFKNAKMISDLTPDQRENFVNSIVALRS